MCLPARVQSPKAGTGATGTSEAAKAASVAEFKGFFRRKTMPATGRLAARSILEQAGLAGRDVPKAARRSLGQPGSTRRCLFFSQRGPWHTPRLNKREGAPIRRRLGTSPTIFATILRRLAAEIKLQLPSHRHTFLGPGLPPFHHNPSWKL